MTGETLTHWTIRIALTLYALVLAMELTARGTRRERMARLLWTAACAAFLAHVAAAFHHYHGWSHQHAFEDTARQTRDLLGVAFGAGIWFSYVFTLLWIADVSWWWLAPAAYRGRSRWLHVAVHGFMFFIAFNGAVVFESGVTRWWGVPVTLALAGLLAWRWMGNNGRLPADSPAHFPPQPAAPHD